MPGVSAPRHRQRPPAGWSQALAGSGSGTPHSDSPASVPSPFRDKMTPAPPTPMERQRRFPRIPSANTVLVAQVDGAQVDHFARTKTVGLGGCGFHYPEPLVPGAIVELMIAVRPEAIKTLARVVYQHPSPGGDGFEVGVEFLALEPEHRRTLEHLLGPEAEESPIPV